MSLCRVCLCFSFRTIYHEEFKHHRSVDVLRASALSGCPLCTLLYGRLCEEVTAIQHLGDSPDSQIVVEKWPSDIDRVLKSPQTLYFRIGSPERAERASLMISAPFGDLASSFVVTRIPYASSTCDELFDHILKWINTCSEQHFYCQSRMPPLPTRVIDVGSRDGSQSPRLLISAGRFAEYLTLSYCWGNHPSLKTTEANLKEFCDQINPEDLPATVMDAIMITRRLGFRYLWVDALCIIQDSRNRQDWEAESAKMAKVYGNSFLTIVAAGARHCGEGIFLQRDFRNNGYVNLPFFSEDGAPCGQVVVWSSDAATINSIPRLNTRGWTFQERHLARRRVEFRKNTLLLGCRAGEVDEMYGFIQTDSPFRRLGSWLDTSLFTPHADTSALLDQWYGYVSSYSERQLSVESDRLPALAGLASRTRLAIPVDARCLAGLWDCDFTYALTWKAHRGYKGTSVVGRLSASLPTWSWVSTYGGVVYEPPYAKPGEVKRGLKIVSVVDTSSITTDMLGRVTGGVLTIDGPFRSARWLVSDIWTPLRLFGDVEALGSADVTVSNNSPFAFAMLDDKKDRPESIWCLSLYSTSGLILAKLGPSSHTYRRIGYFCTCSDVTDWRTSVARVNII